MRICFFGGAISTEEPGLAMFQYKEDDRVTYENDGYKK